MKKGTVGTHYKSNRKNTSFTIRISERDLQMIRKKADLMEMSMAEFIISACAGKRVPGYKSEPDRANQGNQDLPGQMTLDDF